MDVDRVGRGRLSAGGGGGAPPTFRDSYLLCFHSFSVVASGLQFYIHIQHMADVYIYTHISKYKYVYLHIGSSGLASFSLSRHRLFAPCA